jgi:hypothetical protein
VPLMTLIAPACTGDSVHEPAHGHGAVSDHRVTVCNRAGSTGLTSAAARSGVS